MSDREDKMGDELDRSDAGQKVIAGGAFRGLGYVAGVLLSVVSAGLMFRDLGVVDSGRYVAVISLVTIVAGLTDAGLQAVGVREFSVLTGRDRDRFMADMLGLRTVLSLGGVLIGVILAAVLGYDWEMVVGTAVAGVGFVATIIQGAYSVPLQARLKMASVAGLDFLRQALTAVFVVIVVVLGVGLMGFYALTVPAGLGVIILTAVLIRRDDPLIPSLHPSRWWPILRDILPVAIATAMSLMYFRVAIVLLSVISTETQTGYFGASFRISEVLIIVPSLLVTTAFPILSRAARDDHRRHTYALGKLFEGNLIIGVWMALSLYLIAPFAVDLVAGDKFKPSVELLQIQAPAMAGTFLAATWVYALLSLRKHRVLIVVNAFAFVLATVLAIVLISGDGARGAAITMTVTELVLAIFGYLALRLSGTELQVQILGVVKVLLAAGVALAVPILFGLPSLFATVLASVIFFLVLLLIRGVPAEVLALVRSRIGLSS